MNLIKLKENKLLMWIIVFTMLATISFAHISLAVILALIFVVGVIKLKFQEGLITTLYASCFCIFYAQTNLSNLIIMLALVILTFKAYAINKGRWESLSKWVKIFVVLSLLYLFLQPVVSMIVLKTIKGISFLPNLYIFIFLFLLIFFASGTINLRRFLKYFIAGAFVSCVIYVIGFIVGFFDYEIVYETVWQIDVWKRALKEIFSNAIYLIFGKSFVGSSNINVSNTYLALLYQYGVLGILILSFYIVLLLKNLKGYSKKILNYIALIFVLTICLVEDIVFVNVSSIYLIVSLMIVFKDCVNILENESNTVKVQAYLFVKRCFDISVALVGLILASIPMLIIAVLVKATSKGPVFFKDKRIGKDGKQIIVYKYRSMYLDAESRLEQYLTKEQYEIWKTERKIENDPRITKLGKIIRKTSLDELPQLINILKGDLSLIGNRPISKLEYETWFNDEEKEVVNNMRPGLTGYWQVYGRSEVDWQSGKRKQMCLYYSNNASVWLDIKIFFKTFIVVIFRKGAR